MLNKKYLLMTLCCFLLAEKTSAQALTCPATFQGKPWVQVTIWSNMSGFGSAECDYQASGDTELTVLPMPKGKEYYKVSGNWQSAMPGVGWCELAANNQVEDCKFAERVTS